MVKHSKEVMVFVLSWHCSFGPLDDDSGNEEIYGESEKEGTERAQERVKEIKAEVHRSKGREPQTFSVSLYKRINIPN